MATVLSATLTEFKRILVKIGIMKPVQNKKIHNNITIVIMSKIKGIGIAATVAANANKQDMPSA